MYIQPDTAATTHTDLFCIFVFAQIDILMQILPERASLQCFDLAETYHKFEMYKTRAGDILLHEHYCE